MRATRARTLAQSFGFALLRNGGWNSGTVLIKRAHAKAEGFRVHAYSTAATASFPFFSCADPHRWPHRGRSRALLPTRRLVWCNACLVISSDHIPKEIFVLYFGKRKRTVLSYVYSTSPKNLIFFKEYTTRSPNCTFLSLLLYSNDFILLINDEQF